VLTAACTCAALAAPGTGTQTVKVSASALGTNILVNSKGQTLYHYLPETKGKIKCVASCAVLWPPLVVAAGVTPTAGPGLATAKLGTIKRPDGRLQVTYNGLALYRDYYDKPGDLNGQGQSGSWFAVTPTGKVTKARAPRGSTPASSAAGAPTGTAGQATASGATATAPAAGGNPEPPNCVPGSSCEGG
jgi:predicted lipoprotein with Yx(FWY)xxD motif